MSCNAERTLILALMNYVSKLLELLAQARLLKILWRIDDTNIEGDETMAFKLPKGRSATAKIQPLDADGNPAVVDGVPTWTPSSPDFATVTPAPDGMSAKIVWKALGATQVSVSADADLGQGVRNITGLLDLETVGGEATSLSVNFALDDLGTQPPPPPPPLP